MKDLITILIPTHFLPSAPSINIIQTSINSYKDWSELKDCRCIINYDMPTSQQPVHLEYLENLKKLDTNFNLEVNYIPGAQQRKSFIYLINQVKTKYFLFFEHDWLFIEKPNLTKLVEVMNKKENINVVYFNKRNNILHPNEPIMLKDDTITELPLLKTIKWSNNPNLTRKAIWDNNWMEVLVNYELNKDNPIKQTEFALHRKYKREIEVLGFDKAHSKWGCYSYGELGKNKMVKHLNGSERY